MLYFWRSQSVAFISEISLHLCLGESFRFCCFCFLFSNFPLYFQVPLPPVRFWLLVILSLFLKRVSLVEMIKCPLWSMHCFDMTLGFSLNSHRKSFYDRFFHWTRKNNPCITEVIELVIKKSVGGGNSDLSHVSVWTGSVMNAWKIKKKKKKRLCL